MRSIAFPFNVIISIQLLETRLLLTAILVRNCARGLASRLAGCLAFSASRVLRVGFQVSLVYRLDMLHQRFLHYSRYQVRE